MLKIHRDLKQKKFEKTSSCRESSDLRHKNASESSDLKQEKINNHLLNEVLRRQAGWPFSNHDPDADNLWERLAGETDWTSVQEVEKIFFEIFEFVGSRIREGDGFTGEPGDPGGR